MDDLTPMMRQYRELKTRHADTILLFRLGDFYEMFFEDAHLVSKLLGLTLTGRGAAGNKAPMCGVPYHAAESYINKLIRMGHKVAVCEQTEDPKLAKGLVRRDVVQVFSPGTVVSASLLEEKANNYLAAVWAPAQKGDPCGLSYVDLSTGKFRLSQPETFDRLAGELVRIRPSELLYSADGAGLPPEKLKTLKETLEGCRFTPADDLGFEPESARAALLAQFRVLTLDGFGCEGKKAAIGAAGAILAYLKQNLFENLAHLTGLIYETGAGTMALDEMTRRTLAIEDSRPGEGSLFAVLDQTLTAIGGRTLRDWVRNPLVDVDAIRRRQQGVEEFLLSRAMADAAREELTEIKDIERIFSRISCGFANPRDLLGLKLSLRRVPALKRAIEPAAGGLLQSARARLHPLEELVALIESAVVDDPPALLREGGFIKRGYHAALDECVELSTHGKQWVKALQQQEIERTGIKSLKILYNKVFGYYIEVTKANLDQIPPHYIRKQTMVGAERFITPELKEQEQKILGAEEKRKALEQQLFRDLLKTAAQYGPQVLETAQAVGELDALQSLAMVALKHQYVRPEVDGGEALVIRDGRHPVIERALGEGKFVANDTEFDAEGRRVLLITGPNMAGKSTYLRQAALIVLMAQIGSFVPATAARVGVVDRIFTRIGAADDILRGRSTFLVEMNETAVILNHATARSLIVLDEIGRGTSTFDGLSIAWAVVEHIARRVRAKTLFATHYHELTELAVLLPGVVNLNVSVREWNDTVIFVRRIVPGGSDKSYGIHVAKLAGLPQTVVDRAFEILGTLETINYGRDGLPRLGASLGAGQGGAAGGEVQLTFFDPPAAPAAPAPEHPVVEELRKLDADRLTPLEALQKLHAWKRRVSAPGE